MEGDTEVETKMLDFVRTKLTLRDPNVDGNVPTSSSPSKPGIAELAVLSTRISLYFEPSRQSARELEENLHREYIRSGTPSEPILAEAAAHERAIISNRNDDSVATVLHHFVDSDLIDKGFRGELIARLMLTLAYDQAITNHWGTREMVKMDKSFAVVDVRCRAFWKRYWEPENTLSRLEV
ncbi:hypothetical protein FRB95_005989 [Tulasnella sp. JGI-2019a]|nr:hypothetical protein FRB95_005989 [Tulasnella sp. JGI-2019a]